MFYVFDGSENRFLTAVLLAYQDETARISSKSAQLLLGQEPVFVQTDDDRAQRAKTRLLSFDKGCHRDLNALLRCGQEDTEQVAFEYLRFLAQKKRPVRGLI